MNFCAALTGPQNSPLLTASINRRDRFQEQPRRAVGANPAPFTPCRPITVRCGQLSAAGLGSPRLLNMRLRRIPETKTGAAPQRDPDQGSR
jgi:hypothetical protein